MADIELLVKQLRLKGHTVEGVHPVPENAGVYELTVDGAPVNLEEARRILEADEAE